VLAIGTLVALGQTKINDVHSILSLVISANQEIVRFNITMDDSLLMDNLDSLDHLDTNVQNSFEIKFSSTFLEQVLQTFT
jgi:hypothetical protein